MTFAKGLEPDLEEIFEIPEIEFKLTVVRKHSVTQKSTYKLPKGMRESVHDPNEEVNKKQLRKPIKMLGDKYSIREIKRID